MPTNDSNDFSEHEKIKQVADMLATLIEDTSIPRNVRASITVAKQKLEGKADLSAAISGAVYSLDEVSNDINMPMHARTIIWNILSELESLREHLN